MMPSIEWKILRIILHYLKSTHFTTQHFNPLLFVQLNFWRRKSFSQKRWNKNIWISSWWWLYVDAKCDENINQFTHNPPSHMVDTTAVWKHIFSLSKKWNHNKKDDVWISISVSSFQITLNTNSIYGKSEKGYWKHHQFIANEIWISW